MPLFSVIVPVYNVGSYLQECLDSVLNQTLADWECICVDDGSVDGSDKILDAHVRGDKRIRIVHQRNGGVSRARNRALERAQGAWLLFLDADDVWREMLLESVSLVDRPVDLITFGVWYGSVVADFMRQPVVRTCPRYEDWSAVLPQRAFGLGFGQCAYRRRVMGTAVRFDVRYAYGEDRLWLLEAAERVNQVAILDGVFYGYRCREGSAMRAAVSLKRVQSEFGYSCEMLKRLTVCKKQLHPRAVHEFMTLATERTVMWIQELPRGERRGAWEEWFLGLRQLVVPANTGIWFRLVVRVLRHLPFRWLALLLCGFPHWLKEKGIHR